MSFQPRQRRAVMYHSDASLWIERVVLSAAQESRFLLLTPDREITMENPALSNNDQIRMVRLV